MPLEIRNYRPGGQQALGGRNCQHRARRDGDRSRRRRPSTDALGVHCLTVMEYIEAQGWTF